MTEIDDEVLLRADVLLDNAEGAADLLLGEGLPVFRGQSVVLHRARKDVPPVRKVRSADHYIIPGMSDMIIEAFVETEGMEDLAMVVPHQQLAERCSVVMAPGLVNLGERPSVPLLVIKPHSDPASIKQDMVVGLAEPVTPEQCSVVGSPTGIDSEGECVRTTTVAPCTNDVPDHLQQLYQEAADGRDASQRAQIAALLERFSGVFSKNSEDLGLTHLTEHAIDTGDARPFKQPPHRVPAAFAGEDKKAIQKLQRQGVIRPSTSPWASPIVLVHKKDGSVRFCTDYRRLNQCTRKDAFPIPRTEDCLDAVAGASLFSTMDITSAYHQIPVHQGDIPKTAFVTKYGLYEYVHGLWAL